MRWREKMKLKTRAVRKEKAKTGKRLKRRRKEKKDREKKWMASWIFSNSTKEAQQAPQQERCPSSGK